MIFNKLSEAQRYYPLHPAFQRAFEFLNRPDLKDLPVGTYEIDGVRLFARVEKYQGQGRKAARLEMHKRYLDIQYTIRGDEFIGIRHVSLCTPDAAGFDREKDICFFTNPVDCWLPVPDDHFAIFYPGEDAHAPMAGDGPVHKVVVKIEL